MSPSSVKNVENNTARPVELLTVPATGKPDSAVIYRHPLPVRVFHWVNALSFILLLMSGLQIFNYYPRLHWGAVGDAATPAIFEINGIPDLKQQKSWIQFGAHRFDTSGWMGVAKEIPVEGIRNVAFPPCMTLPSIWHLGMGMGWHFLMLWILIANLGCYAIYGLVSGRFRRTLLPNRDQLRPAAIMRDMWMHLRLRHSVGAEALRYNLLQKLSYIVVLAGLLPSMILTGLTMSPSMLAAFPWLLDLFQGRQTARTLHFVFAFLLSMFVLVHLFQVLICGVVNHMRSIITGHFSVPAGEQQ